MSDHFYRDNLYPLQDKVLDLMAKNAPSFYLTGGTALSRFMLNHRYSDDLDFFCNRISDFQHQINAIQNVLSVNFEKVVVNNKQDSYARFMVYDAGAELKLEFVDDVGFRVGEPAILDIGFRIDTWQNILSNKLTAITNRRAGKDFVDILFLSLRYNFNWETIVDYAKQKDAWITEITISESLSAFSEDLLPEVKFPSEFDTVMISLDYFKTLARESLHGFDNSLFGQKL